MLKKVALLSLLMVSLQSQAILPTVGWFTYVAVTYGYSVAKAAVVKAITSQIPMPK